MKHIAVTEENGVLTLQFNRTDKKNAITAEMYGIIADEMQRAATDSQIKVVVILGKDSIFTAGNDLADFAYVSQHPEFSITELPVLRFMHAIVNFDKPIIACVTGPAIGIGTTLLFHCDSVIASEQAVFSLPFVHLNLVPEFGSSLLFPRIAGPVIARHYFLTGEAFTASDALQFGVVSRVCPHEQTVSVAMKLAASLAAMDNRTLRAIKGILSVDERQQILDTIDKELLAFEEALKSPAHRRALNAFFTRKSN